ncbi:MAG: NfeD family protein [Rhodothermales bacterium]|nr:NfeD family protein [Rhodothermales bacterium]MBO6779454.1 NfeD family protein [Rhodothermales bacterium]
MDSVYLISLIVGGFFVLLSIFGADHEGDFDADADVDAEFDLEADTEFEIGMDSETGSGVGLVDLFSLRALFLFAAFFGLTGFGLGLVGEGEPLTLITSILVGLTVGLGGNYVIKKFAYEQVSSTVGVRDYKGRTAKVVLPFTGAENGKITLEAKGQRLQLPARSLDLETIEAFKPGDEVVVVRMDGRVAEVVKPN